MNESQILDAAITLHRALRDRGIGPDIHWAAASADHACWCKETVAKGEDLDLHWELRRKGYVPDEHLIQRGNDAFVEWLDKTHDAIQLGLRMATASGEAAA